MIIDAHTHINEKRDLLLDFQKSRLEGINVIAVRNLIHEKQILDEIELDNFNKKKIYVSAGISLEDLTDEDSFEYYEKFDCIKIHPRLQNIDASGVERIIHKLREFNIRKPIIIDFFPYTSREYLLSNYQPINYERLIKEFQEYKIVFAHFGGIYIREVFILMKCYKNLYADTSLITRYFKDSVIAQEMYYYIKRLNGERVLFGSDFPEIDLDENLDLQVTNFKKCKIESSQIDNILGHNFLNMINS